MTLKLVCPEQAGNKTPSRHTEAHRHQQQQLEEVDVVRPDSFSVPPGLQESPQSVSVWVEEGTSMYHLK